MDNYSVLIPVYAKEKPDRLRQSLRSMLGQTVPPAEIVVVCDGPLTESLYAVLEEAEKENPPLYRFVKLEKNVGLGAALTEGVKACSHEFIARMDSDDISGPERCALQLAAFEKNPGLVIVGGQIGEFLDDPEKIITGRFLPIKDDAIRRFSKKRNPFNHMSVMLKKSAVLSAGNYQPMSLFEDYWLWMRMLRLGMGENLPELLVRARAGDGMIARRGGWRYAKCIRTFMLALYKGGYISLGRCLINIFIRIIISLMPVWLRGFVYSKILRRSDR